MTDNVMPLREPSPRLPPINIEAEQHLLGAFLCNNGLLEVVADFLKPEHFANAMHARILEAIQKLVDRGQIASPVTLKATFDQDRYDFEASRQAGANVKKKADLVAAEDKPKPETFGRD